MTGLVLAIVFYSNQTDADERLRTLTQRYNNVASDTDLSGPLVTQLRGAKQAANSQQKDLTFAITQSQSLANKMAGVTDAAAAEAAADAAMSQVAAALAGNEGDPAISSQENLTAAAQAAATELQALRTRLAAAESRTAAEQAQAETEASGLRDQIVALQTQVEEATNQMQAAEAARVTELSQAEELLGMLESQVEEVVAVMGEERSELFNAVAALQDELEKGRDELVGATKIIQQKVDNSDAPDGEILQSPSGTRLVIGLGREHGVFNGLTFNVYDEGLGVPPIETDPNDPTSATLARGKASIQVINVGKTSSEARIVSQQPGTTIREGDLIANLAYDPNVRRAFHVFGSFDFNGDGNATADEAEEIKSLVREFGGRLADGVTIETDIVVLGRRPEVPELSQAELDAASSIVRQQYFQAEQELRAYEAVQAEANRLNKPIINQNELLTSLGYYDLAAQ
jgi:hypothetical protein